jgi:hypothetical protein
VIVTDLGEFKIENIYAALDDLGTSRIDYLIFTTRTTTTSRTRGG